MNKSAGYTLFSLASPKKTIPLIGKIHTVDEAGAENMEFQVKCKCGSPISIREEDVFSEIRCPFCGKSYLLSELDEELYQLYYSRRKAEFEISNQSIRKYSGAGGKVVIPNDVFFVSDRAFARNGSVENVVCQSLKNIGNEAFANCTGLKEIVFADGLESIGASAFGGCRSLGKINLPASVTLVDEEAFVNCKGITEVAFARGSKATIGKSAFEGCEKIAEIKLRDGMRVGERAFADCENLDKVVIDGVVSLKDGAFADCGRLTVYITCKKGLVAPKWFNSKAFGKHTKIVWNYKEA